MVDVRVRDSMPKSGGLLCSNSEGLMSKPRRPYVQICAYDIMISTLIDAFKGMGTGTDNETTWRGQ